MAPNLIDWDRVLPYCTGEAPEGPYWAILDGFQGSEQEAGASQEPISHLFGYPNDLNGLKISTVGQGITILY